MKSLITTAGMLLLAFTGGSALAQIQLTTVAEAEITETDAEGGTVTRRVPATRVVPGTEVIYTLTAENGGSEPADGVVVTNPIPEQTVYVDGSGSGDGADISFSVDGGKRFDRPERLTRTDEQGRVRPATAEDYTHIRWTLRGELPPGGTVPLSYRVRIK